MALVVAGKGALLSLVALGVATALRRASAASRHLVLAFAAAALLLLPLLVAVLPAWHLAVLPHPLDPPLPSHAQPPGGEVQRVEVRRDLPLIPLAVSLLLVLRLALAVHRLSGLRANSRPAPAAWRELLDAQRRRLGIARSVHLAVSSAVAVPVTFGWRRPVVLIPEAALGWDEQPLREALVHELSHVRRGDWPVQMIARAACALHWFDPLVWLLCRRLRLEAELACDDQVLRAGAGAEGYAERLVTLARQVRGSSRTPASAVAFGRPSELARRVAAILDSGRRRGGPGRLARAGASAAALLLLLLLAPAHLVRAEPERPQAARLAVEEMRAALAKPDSIREGIEGAVARTAEIPEEAVEQGVSDGAHKGVNEDSIRDGARQGIDEGTREALPDAAEVPVQSGASPNTAVPGDGKPLSVASREYAELLHRILSGSFFEPVVPGKGKGC